MKKEKFYIITDAAPIHKAYFEWKTNEAKVNEIVKDVLISAGVETKEYAISDTYFVINPTENDKQKFASQLRVIGVGRDNWGNVLKKNSPINKALREKLNVEGLKVLSKPFLPFAFNNIIGLSRSRLFDIKGVLYGSIETHCNLITPSGFTEIKASEFYTAIENEGDSE